MDSLVDLPNELLRELLLVYADYQYNLLNLLLTNKIFSILPTKNDTKLLMRKYCNITNEHPFFCYKLPNGISHGIYVELYLFSHGIFNTGSYKRGSKSGKWILYDPAGNIKIESNYKKGYLHGKYTVYNHKCIATVQHYHWGIQII